MTVTLSLLCLQAPQDPELAPVGGGFERLENGLRLRLEALPGSRQQSMVLVFPVGADHDPADAAGLAQGMARWIDLAQPASDERHRWQVVVRPGFTMLHCTVPVQDVARRVVYVANLLAGELSDDADVIALARARAALQADDMNAHFPGEVLRARARRALLAGSPSGRGVGGDAAAIEALDAAALWARLRAAYGPGQAIFASLGGIDAAARDELRSVLAGVPARSSPPPAPVVAPAAGDEPAFSEHPLVDAPFVSLVLPAPARGAADELPFAIAIEVLRNRATLAFRSYRGGEARARFPPLDYSFLYGDRLVMLNRRGVDGDPRDAVEGEILALLNDLRLRGVSAVEVANGSRVLAATLALPPYAESVRRAMVEEPTALLSRTLVLTMYEHWQWPRDLCRLLGQVRIADVQRLLAERLQAGQRHWFGLLRCPPANERIR